MKRTEAEAKHYRIFFFRVDHMELWGGYVCVWLLFNSLFLFDNIFFLFHGFITFANNFLFTFMLFLWLTLVALFRKKEHASRDSSSINCAQWGQNHFEIAFQFVNNLKKSSISKNLKIPDSMISYFKKINEN